MARKHLLIIGRDAAPSVSDILRRDSADSGMQGPLNSTLHGYGLASLARESDGGGAPIFTPEFPKADPYHLEKGRVARS